jgi:pimeloyl-ACP methyl ester carboxylesterase
VAGGLTFYFQPLWVNDQIIRMHLRGQNVQSEYIRVDAYDVHYFEALPPARLRVMGDGTPLVLIHGLGSRGEDWSGMIPGLAAAGFHVYAPDLLGYGRTSKPDVDYSIATQEKLVADFMQAVHLDRADLGGWSMGGWIALKLTLDHPDLVRRLVVYDAAGIYFPPTFNASLFTPTDSVGVSRLTAMLTPHPKPLPAFASRAAVRRLQANAWVIERSVISMEAGKDLLDFRLQNIQKPTLIVWGGEDKLIPPSVGESMHAEIPNSSLLIVDGCGHLAPGECTKPVLEGTLQFLEAQPPFAGSETHVEGAPK